MSLLQSKCSQIAMDDENSGALQVNCVVQKAPMSKVLQVVVRAISSFLIRRAGYRVGEAHTGAVTLIQRFGSALNLNLHYHILFLDGVYIQDLRSGYLKFQRIKAPSQSELMPLLQRISQRVGASGCVGER